MKNDPTYGDIVMVKEGKGKGLKGFVEKVDQKLKLATVWFTDKSNIQGKTGVFLFDSLWVI